MIQECPFGNVDYNDSPEFFSGGQFIGDAYVSKGRSVGIKYRRRRESINKYLMQNFLDSFLLCLVIFCASNSEAILLPTLL